MPDLLPFVVIGLSLGSVYALSGVGLVVLYRTTGVVNYAIGATGAVGALVAWTAEDSGLVPEVAWLLAVAFAIAISVAYGTLVAPRLAGRDENVMAAATLGLALVLLGTAGLVWPDEPRALSLPSDAHAVSVFGVRVVLTKVVALALCLIVAVAIGGLLRHTRLGLNLRAMASDRELSAVLGVRVTRLGAIAWAVSGAISGMAGLLLANLVRLDAATLTFLVISGVAAATIGRLRFLPQTVVGGLVLGVVEACAGAFASVANYRAVLPFVLAITWIVWTQRVTSGSAMSAGAR